jgi:actin-related protein 4
VIPTEYGIIGEKQVFGDNSINTPLAGMSIENPMRFDGTVEDWDTATKLWEYAITSRLTLPKARNPLQNGLNDQGDMAKEELDELAMEGVESQEKTLEENPLLMTETGWNSGKDRERGIEIAMETWGCPAYWLARNGVLAA